MKAQLVELAGWEAQQISKGMNEAALSVLWLTNRVDWARCFYWLVVHINFSTFCVYARSRQRTKTYNNETGKFHNQYCFIMSTMMKQKSSFCVLEEVFLGKYRKENGLALIRRPTNILGVSWNYSKIQNE